MLSLLFEKFKTKKSFFPFFPVVHIYLPAPLPARRCSGRVALPSIAWCLACGALKSLAVAKALLPRCFRKDRRGILLLKRESCFLLAMKEEACLAEPRNRNFAASERRICAMSISK